MVGYARKTNGGWSYSPEAIRILKEFINQFPIMFTYLTSNQDSDKYYELDLFPVPEGCVCALINVYPFMHESETLPDSTPFSRETLASVKEWLKQLPSQGQDAVDCGSLTLDEPQIAAIEKAVHDMKVYSCMYCRCTLADVREQ